MSKSVLKQFVIPDKKIYPQKPPNTRKGVSLLTVPILQLAKPLPPSSVLMREGCDHPLRYRIVIY
jgi:hypothetical protein